ncbi:DDE-type integrase/transposase/recombinase, partial [Bacillus sp. D-CC]
KFLMFIFNVKFMVWVDDITYISTEEGWLYVASLMDLYSKKIVCVHADRTMKKTTGVFSSRIGRFYFPSFSIEGVAKLINIQK